MDLKQDIRLSRMALVALASSLWNRPEPQQKIKNYFCFDRKEEKFNKLRAELENEIFGQINRESLPSETLYAELVDVVIVIGLKIFDWHRFLKRRHFFQDLDWEKLYEIYAKNIYWTHNGCVNQYKTVTSWLSHPDVDLLKVYKMSCWFCFEDVIKKLWVNVSKLFESEEKLFERHGSHFVAYWNCVQKNDFRNFLTDIKKLDEIFGFYNDLSSAEACMFFLAMYKKNFLAAKYFFQKIKPTERESNLVDGFEKLAILYSNTKNHVFQYSQEQMILTAIFLISYLTKETEKLLFEVKIEELKESSFTFCLFDMFAMYWPFNEFFGLVLKTFGRYLKPKEYNICLKNVASELRTRASTAIVSIWKKIFFLLYSETPMDVKKEIDIDEITKHFLDINDLGSLNWIINDTKREANGKYTFVELKCNHLMSKFVSLLEKHDDLLEFIDDVLIPKKFEKTIREEIKLLYDFILKSDFDSIEKVLKSCSEDKKNFLKDNINKNFMSYSFIFKNECATPLKFYEHFLTENDRIANDSVPFRFLVHFITSYVIFVWKSHRENLDVAKKTMDDFLINFFLSDCIDCIVVRNMRELFSGILSNFDDYNWEKIQNEFFFKSDDFESLKDIFEYFDILETPLLDDEIVSRKFEMLMQKNQIDVAKKLLDFWFDNESDKKLFIRNFVSVKGAKCCKFFIGKYCNTDESQEEEFKKFIDFFIKPIEDVESLKSELENWPKVYDEKFGKILNYDSGWDDWDDVLHKPESLGELHDAEGDCYYDEESLIMFLNLLNSRV